MYAEMMTVTRNEAFKREFYRNNTPIVAVEAVEGLTWRAALLSKVGDLLIATGLRMKKFARPTAVFSQELL